MRHLIDDPGELTPDERAAWKHDVQAAFDDELDDPHARATPRNEEPTTE
jgi:hypothetical protein